MPTRIRCSRSPPPEAPTPSELDAWRDRFQAWRRLLDAFRLRTAWPSTETSLFGAHLRRSTCFVCAAPRPGACAARRRSQRGFFTSSASRSHGPGRGRSGSCAGAAGRGRPAHTGVVGSEFISIELAYEIAKKLPTARLEVIDKSGHYVHMDTPRELVQLVTRFLGEEPAIPPLAREIERTP